MLLRCGVNGALTQNCLWRPEELQRCTCIIPKYKKIRPTNSLAQLSTHAIGRENTAVVPSPVRKLRRLTASLCMVSVAACLARSAMRVPHLLSGARGLAAAAPSIAKTERASALSPDEFIALAVTRSVELSHNTKMIELALPHVSDNAGLITSSFIMVLRLPRAL